MFLTVCSSYQYKQLSGLFSLLMRQEQIVMSPTSPNSYLDKAGSSEKHAPDKQVGYL